MHVDIDIQYESMHASTETVCVCVCVCVCLSWMYVDIDHLLASIDTPPRLVSLPHFLSPLTFSLARAQFLSLPSSRLPARCGYMIQGYMETSI